MVCDQLCPALGNVTNAALILPEIPCLLSSLSLRFTCCDTKQEASQQKGFFSGGNGELEFLIVVSSSFFCSLLWWVAPASGLSQHLTLQGCVWQGWAQLCGTNSDTHVLTGFLCFLQMDRRPLTASIVLDYPASKNL